MTLETFGELIASLEIPAVYGYYKNERATPYIAYVAVEKNVIHADGVVVYSEPWIQLQLITQTRDLTAEVSVEELLTENGIAFDVPDLDFDEKQGIHIATYNFPL